MPQKLVSFSPSTEFSPMVKVRRYIFRDLEAKGLKTVGRKEPIAITEIIPYRESEIWVK